MTDLLIREEEAKKEASNPMSVCLLGATSFLLSDPLWPNDFVLFRETYLSLQVRRS